MTLRNERCTTFSCATPAVHVLVYTTFMPYWERYKRDVPTEPPGGRHLSHSTEEAVLYRFWIFCRHTNRLRLDIDGRLRFTQNALQKKRRRKFDAQGIEDRGKPVKIRRGRATVTRGRSPYATDLEKYWEGSERLKPCENSEARISDSNPLLANGSSRQRVGCRWISSLF